MSHGLTGSFPLGLLGSRAGALGIVLEALAVFSAIALVLSAMFAPKLIARLPEDYFMPGEQRTNTRASQARAGASRRRSTPRRILRNAAGVTLVVAGTAMLVLPGQGVLTILAGLSLLDFPGKKKLQLRLLRVPAIRNGMDRIRRRAGKPPLQVDEEEDRER